MSIQLYTDLKQAYVRIKLQELFKCTYKLYYNDKIIRLVKCYLNIKYMVIIQNLLSEPFYV